MAAMSFSAYADPPPKAPPGIQVDTKAPDVSLDLIRSTASRGRACKSKDQTEQSR
jgi:hypothetical protein